MQSPSACACPLARGRLLLLVALLLPIALPVWALDLRAAPVLEEHEVSTGDAAGGEAGGPSALDRPSPGRSLGSLDRSAAARRLPGWLPAEAAPRGPPVLHPDRD